MKGGPVRRQACAVGKLPGRVCLFPYLADQRHFRFDERALVPGNSDIDQPIDKRQGVVKAGEIDPAPMEEFPAGIQRYPEPAILDQRAIWPHKVMDHERPGRQRVDAQRPVQRRIAKIQIGETVLEPVPVGQGGCVGADGIGAVGEGLHAPDGSIAREPVNLALFSA